MPCVAQLYQCQFSCWSQSSPWPLIHGLKQGAAEAPFANNICRCYSRENNSFFESIVVRTGTVSSQLFGLVLVLCMFVGVRSWVRGLPAGEPCEFLHRAGKPTPSPLSRHAMHVRHGERDAMTYAFRHSSPPLSIATCTSRYSGAHSRREYIHTVYNVQRNFHWFVVKNHILWSCANIETKAPWYDSSEASLPTKVFYLSRFQRASTSRGKQIISASGHLHL